MTSRYQEMTMLDLVLGLPEQMAEAEVNARRAGLGRRRRYSNVVVAGMGGSAISGHICRTLLAETNQVHVLVCRRYDLPALVTDKTLFVGISYSGNTEETLSATRHARKRGCDMVFITTGGRLGRMAKRMAVPVVGVPAGLQPRAALGHLCTSLLVALERLGICKSFKSALNEAVTLMVDRREAWLRQAGAIARKLDGNLPMVYGTSPLLEAVLDRWRSQLNENSEVMCHTSMLSEHNHNEVVGMGRPGWLARRSVIVALHDRSSPKQNRTRLAHVLDITRGGYREAIHVESEGRSALARVFSLIMIGDLVSVELAALRGVDAMPVERIVELKRRMAGGKKRSRR
ncbi:MAG: bifunctional phosphoglucose/phosphomannose isomerase [candidate division WOR-3 bacterium]|nr:MAG: bifunctional phosphoglucose/phosphomannose isomerase [candidate division WOR-3 bacterium]